MVLLTNANKDLIEKKETCAETKSCKSVAKYGNNIFIRSACHTHRLRVDWSTMTYGQAFHSYEDRRTACTYDLVRPTEQVWMVYAANGSMNNESGARNGRPPRNDNTAYRRRVCRAYFVTHSRRRQGLGLRGELA